MNKRPEIVFVGLPTYDHRLEGDSALAVMQAARRVQCAVQTHGFSLLAYGFNRLLCDALNNRRQHGLTHFLLMHADVIPTGPGPAGQWLLTLLDEMKRLSLDALSVVVPIKNDQGLTSTGLDMGGANENPWATRRLTMAEIMRLPETFDGRQAADAIQDWPADREPVLLVNTGLLLLDIGRPWIDSAIRNRSLRFTIHDLIVFNPGTGHYRAYAEPEDWGFSRLLHQIGARYATTRKVAVEHVGRFKFPNNQEWGRYVADPVFVDPGNEIFVCPEQPGEAQAV